MAGAGTVTQTITHSITQSKGSGKGGFKIVKFSCVGDASGGGIPATATDQTITNQIEGCYLVKVQTITGTTAPTAGSDLTIKDANGVDLLGGAGTNTLNNTASTGLDVWPLSTTLVTTSTYEIVRQPIIGALTLGVTGDSVASAVYQVWLYCEAANI